MTTAGPPGRLLRIRRTWRRSLPWVVLLAALAVTIVLTQVTRVDSQTDANQYFDQLVTRKARELGAAVAQVERDMRGAAGLVSAVGEPTAAQWAAYVASVAQQDTSASLIELGFAKAETGVDTTAVTVRQVGSIKARPFTRVDEALHKRPNIAAALRRAESDDALTLTPKIENMSGRTDVGPGALLFLPVRNKDVLLGYVYAAVRLDDLASEVARADAGYFRLRAYDGRATTPETLIFASAQTSSDPVFHKTTSLLAGGRPWTLAFESTPALDAFLADRRSFWILVGGLSGSFMLFGLAWSLMRTRQRATEIAERMTLELSDQKKFSEDLIELNPNPIFRKDTNGRYVSFNRAWEKLTGRRREDWIGKSNGDTHDEARAVRYVEQDAEIMANPDRVFRQETQIRAIDGQEFDVIVSKTAVRRADGSVVGVIGTITDFSEAKKLAEQLASQRELLELVNQSAQAGVWDREMPSGRNYLSPRYYDMLGYPAETDLGAEVTQGALLHPDDKARVDAARMAHFSRKEPFFACEYRLRCADGTYLWVNGRGLAVFDEQGHPQRFVGSIIDISERKRVEDEILRQRELLNIVIDSVQAGVFDRDLTTNVGYYSPRARAMLGFAPDDDMAAYSVDPTRYHESDRARVLELRANAIRTGMPYDAECRVRRKDASFLWVHILGQTTFDDAGKPIRFTGALMDISVRKEAELALIEANARIVEAAQAKSTFLATMSHEIRTPLNGVIGSADLLLGTRLTTEQHDYAETIRLSGEQLLMVINDVLDFSKIESGRMELEEAPVELASVIEDAFDLVAGRARDKKLELLYEIEPTVPPHVMGDITRLRQILINLVGNSIKFTEQGEVRVDCRIAQGGVDDLLIECAVRDTGIGIPADKIDRLFNAFTQVDASTSRKYGGTGLGLAICRRLAELMGGTMRVESELGKGSSFIFSFRTRAAAQQKTVRTLGQEGRTPRLLLVDDYPANLRILSAQCAAWGLSPETALDARTAIRMIEESVVAGKPYEAVITDMSMPEMDGLDLAAAIATFREHHKVQLPVIMLSSSPKSEVFEGRNIPPEWISAYMLKPARQSQIYNALQDSLGTGPVFHLSGPDIATPPGTQMPLVTQLAILLAEDNEVNSKIALRMLQRLGCRADAVGNGRLAVEAVGKHRYDCILMDIQMPEMDGLEATRTIVAATTAEERPYIIAMTANAMAGDREMCLAAGMNDYVSKPIQLEVLAKAMGRAAAFREQRLRAAPMPALAREGAIFSTSEIDDETLDMAQVDELIALDSTRGVLAEFVGMYAAQSPERLAELRAAHAAGDLVQLGRVAHSFKGASANLGARRVAATAKFLEHAGKTGDAARVPAWLDELDSRYAEAEAALKALLPPTAQ